MSRARLKWPLFAALLVAAVFGSALRVFWYARPARDTSGRTILRIGHYMLAPTTEAALDAVIADYERRRPDIHVIAMPIPERVYLYTAASASRPSRGTRYEAVGKFS